jgi:two-component system sensor histidine kinase QseC
MRSVQKRMLFITSTLFLSAWLVTLVSTFFSLNHAANLSHDQDLRNYANIISGFAHELSVTSGESGLRAEIEEDLIAEYNMTLAFNIIHQDQVIGRSRTAPVFPRIGESAIRDMEFEVDGRVEDWRVYHHYDEENDTWVIVAETMESLNKFIFSVFLQAVWPNMVFLPLMLLAIFFGVRQSLKPLHDLATQVEVQTPKTFVAIDVGDVPVEVEPLVRSLNHMLRRLRAAFENEHSFTANAAHELRTPLGGLKTEAQILRQLATTDEVKLSVERIEVRVDRAAHLVSQLLTLAKMESNDVLENSECVNLPELVSDVVGDLSQTAKDKDVKLNFSCDTKFSTNGEPIALGVLIRNLIDNAIRYSPTKGDVEVGLREEEGQVILSVVDSGPGIPEDKIDDVFKKFYRVPGSSATGVGLGLSIVKRIVFLHSAELRVTNMGTRSGLSVEVLFGSLT